MSYRSPHDLRDAVRLHERDPDYYTAPKLEEMYRIPESLIEAALTKPLVIVKSENPDVNGCGWTPARVALATEMWRSGKSAREIAKVLKTTRNACISKMHRLGLTGGGKVPPVKEVKEKRNGRQYGPVTMAAIRLDNRQKMAPTIEGVPTEAPGMRKISLVQLTLRNCHWPYGNPREPDFFFCGADVAEESGPYCVFHRRQAFRRSPTDI